MLIVRRQIATHTSHLSTLSSLLLSFLPAHLLPQLPPPSAPHGYPSSSTPASALARRQNFDYPPSNYPGAGSTARMNAAMGMVREHWDLTRGGGMPPRMPKRKPQPTSLHQMGTDGDMGLGGGGGRGLVRRRPSAPLWMSGTLTSLYLRSTRRRSSTTRRARQLSRDRKSVV